MSDWDEFYRNFEANRTSVERSSSAGAPRTITVGSSTLISSSLTPDVEEIPSSLNEVPELVIFGGYAFVSGEKDLRIIHLRRARAKIIYEEYMEAIGQESIISNRLLFPQLIDLGIKEAKLLEAHQTSLQSLGFDISEMGKNSYAINAIPYGMPAGNEADLLLEILEECNAMDKSSEEVVYHRLVSALTAYRMKHEDGYYTHTAVAQMISKINKSVVKLLAPDGKVIVSVLTPKELAKRFGE